MVSLKHQWLFLNSLDTIERLHTLVAFSWTNTTPRCRTPRSAARRPMKSLEPTRTCNGNWPTPERKPASFVSPATGARPAVGPHPRLDRLFRRDYANAASAYAVVRMFLVRSRRGVFGTDDERTAVAGMHHPFA